MLKYSEVLIIPGGTVDCKLDGFKMMAVCVDGLLHCLGDDILRIFEGTAAVGSEDHNVLIVRRMNEQCC